MPCRRFGALAKTFVRKRFVVGNDVHLPAIGILVEFLQTPHDHQHFFFNLGVLCLSVR